MQKSKYNPQPVIVLSHISKRYTIHHEKPTLVEKFYKGREETFWALKNINLIIRKGERVGIVGPNGSGKTTLLKIITGITTPFTGQVYTIGKIVSLIDLEAGFHDDLSGYQNIILNGMLLGMSKNEIEDKLSDIIDYADLKGFIDAPLFTYSSGMIMRLGFSIAIHAQPEIALFDEGIVVGDKYFQKKAEKTLDCMTKKKSTIVYVSHITDFLKIKCKRIIIMDKGEIRHDGDVSLLTKYRQC